jgi:hypothetical protein
MGRFIRPNGLPPSLLRPIAVEACGADLVVKL